MSQRHLVFQGNRGQLCLASVTSIRGSPRGQGYPSSATGIMCLWTVLPQALCFPVVWDWPVVLWFCNKSFSVQDNSSGFYFLRLRTMINTIPFASVCPHSQPGLATSSLADYQYMMLCNFLVLDPIFYSYSHLNPFFCLLKHDEQILLCS